MEMNLGIPFAAEAILRDGSKKNISGDDFQDACWRGHVNPKQIAMVIIEED